MGVYKIKLAGRRKPLHIKAANQTAAIKAVVEAVQLTQDELVEAMESGVTLWKIGDPVPADDPAPKPEGEPEAEGESGAGERAE